MKIIYRKGKRSKHGFMPSAKVTYKDDFRYDWPSARWYIDSEYETDNYRRLPVTKRMQTLKTILRKVKKMNYPEGTRIVVSSWFVGYASVMIIV